MPDDALSASCSPTNCGHDRFANAKALHHFETPLDATGRTDSTRADDSHGGSRRFWSRRRGRVAAWWAPCTYMCRNLEGPPQLVGPSGDPHVRNRARQSLADSATDDGVAASGGKAVHIQSPSGTSS